MPAAGGAAADPFLFLLTIFLLACFVGYYVVWNVTPALHSPLMGVTNAISSVIVVGAILAAGTADNGGRADLRLPRRDLRLGQHLRRLPGHAPDARRCSRPRRRPERHGDDLDRPRLPGRRRSSSSWRCAGCPTPTTSRQGNQFGMIGMAIAIVATLFRPGHGPGRIVLILAGIAIGGSDRRRGGQADPDDRAAATRRGLPLAGRHGCGLRRRGGLLRPGKLRHRHARRYPRRPSLVEMSLGLAIGAITFSGSVIAFAKLDGRMSRRADHLPEPAQAERRRSARCCWCWSSPSS